MGCGHAATARHAGGLRFLASQTGLGEFVAVVDRNEQVQPVLQSLSLFGGRPGSASHARQIGPDDCALVVELEEWVEVSARATPGNLSFDLGAQTLGHRLGDIAWIRPGSITSDRYVGLGHPCRLAQGLQAYPRGLVSGPTDGFAFGRQVSVRGDSAHLGREDLSGLGPNGQSDGQHFDARVLEGLHLVELDVGGVEFPRAQRLLVGGPGLVGQPRQPGSHRVVGAPQYPRRAAHRDPGTKQPGQHVVDIRPMLAEVVSAGAVREGLTAGLALVSGQSVTQMLRGVVAPFTEKSRLSLPEVLTAWIRTR